MISKNVKAAEQRPAHWKKLKRTLKSLLYRILMHVVVSELGSFFDLIDQLVQWYKEWRQDN